jgi:hypothetical protein
MKSSTGLSTARTVALRADQMPSGIAISTVTTPATSTSASVCIAGTQRPIATITPNESAVPIASFQERTSQAMSAAMMMTT